MGEANRIWEFTIAIKNQIYMNMFPQPHFSYKGFNEWALTPP